jgi:hypothetical protein
MCCDAEPDTCPAEGAGAAAMRCGGRCRERKASAAAPGPGTGARPGGVAEPGRGEGDLWRAEGHDDTRRAEVRMS